MRSPSPAKGMMSDTVFAFAVSVLALRAQGARSAALVSVSALSLLVLTVLLGRRQKLTATRMPLVQSYNGSAGIVIVTLYQFLLCGHKGFLL